MASATRSKDFLVSTVETIQGSKLPSGEQVLGLFLYRHNVLKEDIRTAATYAIEQAEQFWVCANIPTKHRKDSIQKLEELFYKRKGLMKNKKRRSEKQQRNEEAFSAEIIELFDIAHANAMDLITNEEDKLFLQSQRQKGRQGYMGSIDKEFHKQQLKKNEKNESLLRRRNRSDVDKEALVAQAMLASSSDEDLSEEMDTNDVDHARMTSESTKALLPGPPSKRGRQMVLSPQLAAMLDRNGLSDRAAMMIIFETSRALGQDLEQLVLNKSSINRQRKDLRESAASGIKESFKPNTMLTVHWDGKLMADLTGNDKVDRLPILVSTMGDQKLLDIPKLTTGSGQVIAQALYSAIKEWKLENLVRAMCFDTTSSNTGRLSGACVILERLLGRPLLHFGCRHHIMELVLAAAFTECMGPNSAPEILLFKRFREQWASINQETYNDASSDEFTLSELVNIRAEVIAFCSCQLLEYQSRDDYRELLKLMIIFLGGTPAGGIKFRAPGPMSQARWMAKAIYSLKVWLFRAQFKLTTRECQGLRDLNIFLAKVYVKYWFLAPKANTAARNDLQLLQQLDGYHKHNIGAATSRKLAGHLWYLSEDLILFSLFDPDVDAPTKRAMLKVAREKDGDNSFKRAAVDLANIQQRTLVDFVSKKSKAVFASLGIPDGFVNEDPDEWSDRDDFIAAKATVCSLATTNDHAERGVALIQEATQSKRFRSEDQLQYALQVIEQNRALFPDAKKSTLLKKQ